MRPFAVILLATAVMLGGCGKSDEDKARDQVCDARADMSKQVDELKKLTPSTVTFDAVRKGVQAIADDLKKIADAQGKLSDQRGKEVKAANDAFAAEVKDVTSTVLRSTTTEEARTQLQAAVTALADSYSSTFGKIDCG